MWRLGLGFLLFGLVVGACGGAWWWVLGRGCFGLWFLFSFLFFENVSQCQGSLRVGAGERDGIGCVVLCCVGAVFFSFR